ncbi:92b3508f-77c4-4d20-b7c2-49aecde0ee0b [Sclerotinia trifoliorum]|uniref:92b3508f-77c4-4d20-b7c2-49aecde0ee0b n=1 Tax=Sclerotinia trifoliorum TaxID=28548 RepID=A0A8H2VPI7_9HELO|nr:92b3508f-77c4-4d20-b7c2-49aecde0ee0b [Sclerotinia trifoliorum]
MADPSDDLGRHNPRDPFDPNFLPNRWLPRIEVLQWKAGVHPDQLSARRRQREDDERSSRSYEHLSCEDAKLMLQHDLYCEAINVKYDRKDKSTRLFLSTQIKLIDHQIKLIDHKFKLATLGGQLMFFLCFSITCFGYIFLLCYSGHYYTPLGLLLLLSLMVCWIEYQQRPVPQAPTL